MTNATGAAGVRHNPPPSAGSAKFASARESISCLVSYGGHIHDAEHHETGRDRPIMPWSEETGGQRGSSRPLTCRARTVAWAEEPASQGRAIQEVPMKTPLFVGTDVSQSQLDVAVR